MSQRVLIITGLGIIPCFFLLGAATSDPPWVMESLIGHLLPLGIFAGFVCLAVAASRFAEGNLLKFVYVLGALAVTAADVALSVVICVLIWGMGIS